MRAGACANDRGDPDADMRITGGSQGGKIGFGFHPTLFSSDPDLFSDLREKVRLRRI